MVAPDGNWLGLCVCPQAMSRFPMAARAPDPLLVRPWPTDRDPTHHQEVPAKSRRAKAHHLLRRSEEQWWPKAFGSDINGYVNIIQYYIYLHIIALQKWSLSGLGIHSWTQTQGLSWNLTALGYLGFLRSSLPGTFCCRNSSSVLVISFTAIASHCNFWDNITSKPQW